MAPPRCPALADAGYRAVAPFIRGYAPTAVPADGRYQTGALAADANALHEALGGDADAVIIGHDWGALAAYGAAVHEPDRWSRVVAMAVPPGGAMAAAFVTSLDQVQRSWYMFFFQHPLADLLVVPPTTSPSSTWLWAQWSPGYDADGDVADVRESLADTGQRAGCARLLPRHARRRPQGSGRSTTSKRRRARCRPQPTLYLHGRDDGCVGVEVADLAAAMTAGADQRDGRGLDDAGHFLHLERPDAVNDRILEFLT